MESAGTTVNAGTLVYQRKWGITPALSTLPLGPNVPLDTGSGSTTIMISCKNVSPTGSALLGVLSANPMGSACLVKIKSLTPILFPFSITMYFVKLVLLAAFHVQDLINSSATAIKINSKETQFMIQDSDFVCLGSIPLALQIVLTAA
jgi:hypothetical protein